MKALQTQSNSHTMVITCQVGVCSGKLKPVHLTISLLKRNLGTGCRLLCRSLRFQRSLNRTSITLPYGLFRSLIYCSTWWCINHIKGQRANSFLLLWGRINFPYNTTILCLSLISITPVIIYTNLTNSINSFLSCSTVKGWPYLITAKH